MKSLERRIGLAGATAISVSAMIGSGIFVLPGLAAAKTGPSVWMAYIAASLCVLPAALSKAELATAMPVSGGSYFYLDRTFGPLAGTIFGLGLWLSLLLKGSFALVGFGTYLAVISELPLRPTALALLGLITVINVVGVKAVSRVQLAVVVLILAGLAVVGTAALGKVEATHFEDAYRHGFTGFVSAMAFVFVSYAGVTKIAAIAEEIERPSRNLPLSMVSGLAIATLLYGTLAFLLVGVVPLDQLSVDLHPVATLGASVGGDVLGYGAAVLGVIAMVSMANAGLLTASRFPFAMSRDRLLPAGLAGVHRRHITPVAAILVTTATMAVAILALNVEGLAKLASAFVIMVYVGECFAVIVLRESHAAWYRPPYRSPLYPWLQCAGGLAGLGLLVALGTVSLLAVAGIGLPGLVLYLAYGRRRIERSGVLSKMGVRTELLQSTHPELRTIEADGNEARVVVPLFGKERSPEMVTQVGGVIADGNRVEVMHVTEIPEQTALDSVLDEHPRVRSLRRRILTMGDEEGIDLAFDAIVSRDVAKTVYDAANRLHSEWLVMEWSGRTERGLVARNPMAWLTHHLPCNLALFKDAGVRYVRRIMVLPEPGPHDSLVVTTADHLAAVFGASLTFVRHLPAGSPAASKRSQRQYLNQLRNLCTAKSRVTFVGGPDRVAALAEESAAHDMLVMGAPAEWTLRSLFFGSAEDRLTTQAGSSVLRLTTPRKQPHSSVFRGARARKRPDFDLMSFVDPRCVEALVQAGNKAALFVQLARAFQGRLPNQDHQKIVQALWERERAQNTAVELGVAIPHAVIDEAERTYLGIFTTAHPIAYQAPDGQKVSVFFVLLGPAGDRQTHLEILSGVSRLVLKTKLLGRLRAATSRDAIIEALAESLEELADDQREGREPTTS